LLGIAFGVLTRGEAYGQMRGGFGHFIRPVIITRPQVDAGFPFSGFRGFPEAGRGRVVRFDQFFREVTPTSRFLRFGIGPVPVGGFRDFRAGGPVTVRHGLVVGRQLAGFPCFSFVNGFAFPFFGVIPAGALEAGDEALRPGDRIAVPGSAGAGDSLVVEEVSPGSVRLTWNGGGREADQVGLFLADSARTVLGIETVAGPPYSATLDAPPSATLAGVTVVWPRGGSSTTLVQFRAPRR
jgi:hypothetical protein